MQERLGQAVLLNPPSVFTAFWYLIKPFIDERTVQKVHFLHADSSHSAREALLTIFPSLDNLEQYLGGDAPRGFEPQSYGIEMREEEARLQTARAAWAAGTGPPCP